MFVVLVGKWWWIVGVDISASGLGLAEAFGGRVPKWVWVATLICGLVFASFVAFHRLRLQYEAQLLAASGRADVAEAKLRGFDPDASFLTETQWDILRACKNDKTEHFLTFWEGVWKIDEFAIVDDDGHPCRYEYVKSQIDDLRLRGLARIVYKEELPYSLFSFVLTPAALTLVKTHRGSSDQLRVADAVGGE